MKDVGENEELCKAFVALQLEYTNLDKLVQEARLQAESLQEELKIENQLLNATKQHVARMQRDLRKQNALKEFIPVVGEIRIEIHSDSITLHVNQTTTFADLVNACLTYLGYEDNESRYKRCDFLLRNAQGVIFCPEDLVAESFAPSLPWFAKLSTRTRILRVNGLYEVFDPESELIAYRQQKSAHVLVETTSSSSTRMNNEEVEDPLPNAFYVDPVAFATTAVVTRLEHDKQSKGEKPFIKLANAMRRNARRKRLLLESVLSICFMLFAVFASFALGGNGLPSNVVQAYTNKITPLMHTEQSLRDMLNQDFGVLGTNQIQIRQLRVRCNDYCPRFSPREESRECYNQYCFSNRTHVFNPSIWTVTRGLIEASFDSNGGFFLNHTAMEIFPAGFVDEATRYISIEFYQYESNPSCVVSVKIMLQYLGPASVLGSNNSTTFPFQPVLLVQAESASYSTVPTCALCIVAILNGFVSISLDLRPANGDLDVVNRMDGDDHGSQHLLQSIVHLLGVEQDNANAHRLKIPSFVSRYVWLAWDSTAVALLFTGLVYTFACLQPEFDRLIDSSEYVELAPYFYAKQVCSNLFGFASWMSILGTVRCLRVFRVGTLVLDTALDSTFPGLFVLFAYFLLPICLAFGATGQLLHLQLATENVWLAVCITMFYLFAGTAALLHVFAAFELQWKKINLV